MRRCGKLFSPIVYARRATASDLRYSISAAGIRTFDSRFGIDVTSLMPSFDK